MDTLEHMNESIRHRGPDDQGAEIFVSDGHYVGLAHSRLAILELSALGHQPMHTQDKKVSIVFNGEIYNFKELKKELNCTFLSNSDTEVILEAYRAWGMGFLSRLNGMFAMAIYDHEKACLHLVRDRIGQKPLYYWPNDEGVVFASEMKPIMRAPGFSKTIRRDTLQRYLYQGYIQAPDTVFEGVYELEPGTCLTFQGGREAEKRRYWDLLSVYKEKSQHLETDYTVAKETLKQKLLQSVRYRMIADVPVGAFISGGIDSSLLAALAQSSLSEPLYTYTIGFEDKQYDEAPYARAIADYLGTKHTELYISESDMLELVQSIPQYYDVPFGDSSQIPMMLVSKLARQSVTVALSGDGGDEFYCGYTRYKAFLEAQRLDLPGAALHMLGQIPAGKGQKLEDRFPYAVQTITRNRDPRAKTQYRGNSHMRYIEQIAPQGLPMRYLIEDSFQESNWQIRGMLLDMISYLPGDILCKVDRASMKYALEARCPYLDVDVMEYSFSLAHAMKYRQGNKKRILKDLCYDMIPRDLLERSKTGFSVPKDKWMKTALRQQLEAYSRAAYLKEQDLFHPANTQQMIDHYLQHPAQGSGSHLEGLVWNFFMFQMWHDYYIR